MAFALVGTDILPLVTRRDVVNDFELALRPDLAIELGDIDNPEGAELFLTAFENAISKVRKLAATLHPFHGS